MKKKFNFPLNKYPINYNKPKKNKKIKNKKKAKFFIFSNSYLKHQFHNYLQQ